MWFSLASDENHITTPLLRSPFMRTQLLISDLVISALHCTDDIGAKNLHVSHERLVISNLNKLSIPVGAKTWNMRYTSAPTTTHSQRLWRPLFYISQRWRWAPVIEELVGVLLHFIASSRYWSKIWMSVSSRRMRVRDSRMMRKVLDKKVQNRCKMFDNF